MTVVNTIPKGEGPSVITHFAYGAIQKIHRACRVHHQNKQSSENISEMKSRADPQLSIPLWNPQSISNVLCIHSDVGPYVTD